MARIDPFVVFKEAAPVLPAVTLATFKSVLELMEAEKAAEAVRLDELFTVALIEPEFATRLTPPVVSMVPVLTLEPDKETLPLPAAMFRAKIELPVEVSDTAPPPVVIAPVLRKLGAVAVKLPPVTAPS